MERLLHESIMTHKRCAAKLLRWLNLASINSVSIAIARGLSTTITTTTMNTPDGVPGDGHHLTRLLSLVLNIQMELIIDLLSIKSRKNALKH